MSITDCLEQLNILPLGLAVTLGFVFVMLTVTALVTSAVKDLFVRHLGLEKCPEKKVWKYPCKDARVLRADFSIFILQMFGFMLVAFAMAIVDVYELDWLRPKLTTDLSNDNRPMILEPLLRQWILLAYAFFHLLAIWIILMSVFARLQVVHSTAK